MFERSRTHAAGLVTLVLVLVSAALLLLRLPRLQADFPAGVTTSGSLYTDEGLHASAAIHRVTRGEWIVSGDFNPVVLLPAMELVQGAAFEAAGMSLTTARRVAFVFLVLFAFGFFVLVRGLSSSLVAAAALAITLSDFTLYAFSRLAFLEVPMMAVIVAALLLARSEKLERHPLSRGMLSGLVFSLAVLVKTTAVFALPLLVLALAWRPRQRLRWRSPLAAVLIIAMAIGIHQAIVRTIFAADFAVVSAANFHLTLSPLKWLQDFGDIVQASFDLAPWLWGAVLPLLVLAGILSPRFRRHPLLVGSLFWLVPYLGLLSFSPYNAPRYDVVMVPAVAMLLVLAVSELAAQPRWRALAVPASAFLVWLGAAGAWRIGEYLAHPRWTFRDMAADVRARVRSSPGVPAVLMGHMACQVALATGVACVDDAFGSRPLRWRLAHDRPGWWVTLGIDRKLKASLERVDTLKEIARYHVFGDYYVGHPAVYLFRLRPRPAPLPRPTGGDRFEKP